MELLDASDASLRRAGAALARGCLVALPTETVYGLGADAFDPIAVARVFEVKGRPSFDPLIVHVASIEDVFRVAAEVPPAARRLMEALWPGPLTLVLPKRSELPDLVTSGLPTVAVRFPSHPVGRAIIAYSGTAVAAPSANPFGYLSPTRAEHVVRLLGEKVDFVVDGGPCAVGVESTVLDMTREPPLLLRPGGMEIEAIEAVAGRIELFHAAAPGAAGLPQSSPGLMESHYAPRARLRLFEAGGIGQALALDPAAAPGGPESEAGLPLRVAALVFDAAAAAALGPAAARFAALRSLSGRGDLVEAAAALFALLHELDSLGMDEIWAESVPARGLGPAINDRLYKASRKG